MFTFILICFLGIGSATAQSLQVNDDWHVVDGEKFFVKGIGYETHTRPGQVTWEYSFDPDLIEFDLNRIQDAGFNTIRTWGALREEELKLVEKSGLKILFGIWIDPHGDFSNFMFRTQAYQDVLGVLDYSKKYECIIGYLIMNEPQVQHIYSEGAASLLKLWQSVIDLIHEQHPGVPVSFSNTIIGDFIDMEIFDFAGFNAYVYNPVTISKSHGYAGYLAFLKQNRSANMPFIITEYGLSVSPASPQNEYGYGGNSLEQQTTGDLFMLRGLIDAGAQGNCVFQYHDGWWKGGNENAHDATPEEWFGLIGFSDIQDKYGTPRPVWTAYETYNKAIITNPKNGSIYQAGIPIEIFTTADVASYSISENGNEFLLEAVTGTYHNSILSLLPDDEIKDYQLDFKFYNAQGNLLKSETISILHSKAALKLPEITLEVFPKELKPGGTNYLNIQVTNNPLFSIEKSLVNFVSHPHIGFDAGTARSKVMSLTNNAWSYRPSMIIPAATKVATFGAGFTITYGTFKKRITDQILLIDGDWAEPIAAPKLNTGIDPAVHHTMDRHPEDFGLNNFPNPFNPNTNITYTLTTDTQVRLTISNTLGREIRILVNQNQAAGNYSIPWDGRDKAGVLQASGLYMVRLQSNNAMESQKMMLIR